ncbi:MAG TPA: glycogen phosphorylase [Lentisphaeria bacterium]|nr:MAG: glycogen phosphorylase [Lentisphaerae bacterium GWF2_50_93]HCE43635.1 glycogen phosphorylase [Lentisphaeria bacterium]
MKSRIDKKAKVTKEMIQDSFMHHLTRSLAKHPDVASNHDRYFALALTIRDLLVDKWIETRREYDTRKPKCVCYLSLEYLMGRALGNAMINLEIYDVAKAAMDDLGFDIELIEEEELDAGLGNGGLGRLAACFLDSMATLQYPAFGYGIRYNFGIFKQIIQDGSQVEEPDHWLRQGNAWEIRRPERMRRVRFYGHTEKSRNSDSKHKKEWVDTQDVLAMPYDMPIPGFKTAHVNNLRLWAARSLYGFNLSSFNSGDYINANLEASLTENITKVLYPNDNNYGGKELRLKQQYFLVSATLQDIIYRYKGLGGDIRKIDEKVAIQLNDTHPAMAIPEFMRILVDEEDVDWEEAWGICVKTFSYTNHTLMSEALEKWPVQMLEKLLPRHLEIIYELNDRFLRRIANKYPGDVGRLNRMSFIEENHEKQVRMAYIAVAGSSRVNGVAALHTELLKHGLFKDFYDYYPYKFVNKTNGITPRRWLVKANQGLTRLIEDKIGESWFTNIDDLKKLEKHVNDRKFIEQVAAIKRLNKEVLAKYIKEHNGIKINIDSIFDVHVKRFHEYKRQLLKIIHAITLYLEIKENPKGSFTPRTIIFGGKSAPGYFMAKLIIKFINSVASVINTDEDMNGRLKVVFLANYGVSLAEKIMPAADLSEQISLAGTEASGTGNMKFALNGALTIGTLDGANIEIKEAVGDDNIFIFGMKVNEVENLRKSGYNPEDFLKSQPRLRQVMELIRCGFFSTKEPHVFDPLLDSMKIDYYMSFADFESYNSVQEQVSRTYLDQNEWHKKALMNIANMGRFSSDRTIKEYSDEIWNIKPMLLK